MAVFVSVTWACLAASSIQPSMSALVFALSAAALADLACAAISAGPDSGVYSGLVVFNVSVESVGELLRDPDVDVALGRALQLVLEVGDVVGGDRLTGLLLVGNRA